MDNIKQLKNKKGWNLYELTLHYNKPTFKLLESDIYNFSSCLHPYLWDCNNLFLGRKINKYSDEYEYIKLNTYTNLKKVYTIGDKSESFKYNRRKYKIGSYITFLGTDIIKEPEGRSSRWVTPRKYYCTDTFFDEDLDMVSWKHKSVFTTFKVKDIYRNSVRLGGFSKNNSGKISKIELDLQMVAGTLHLQLS